MNQVVGVYCALAGLTVFFSVAYAQSDQALAEPSRTNPSVLCVAVQEIAADLERIRFEMGKPIAAPADIQIKHAHLRNVHSHAQGLLEKASRLALEHTLTAELPALTVSTTEINEAEVLGVLEQVKTQLTQVKQSMAIPLVSEGPPLKVTPKDPSALLVTIIGLNRQLNILLDKQYAPRDVFQKVTQSVHTLARVLNRFPEVRHIPDEPEFLRGKTPTDVYLRLHDCNEVIVRICRDVGIEMPEIQLASRESRRTPSDVYDLAVLIVTELTHLHTLMENLEPPVPALDPGRKYPSHVYQRAGILERQLALLEEQSTKQPDWVRP